MVADPWCLDGRRFVMVSSSASVVDPDDRTFFDYSDEAGVVRGTFWGGPATGGSFVGSRRGNEVEIVFRYGAPGGELVEGTARSVVSRADDGRLVLTERFSDDRGNEHISVCHEVMVGDTRLELMTSSV